MKSSDIALETRASRRHSLGNVRFMGAPSLPQWAAYPTAPSSRIWSMIPLRPGCAPDRASLGGGSWSPLSQLTKKPASLPSRSTPSSTPTRSNRSTTSLISLVDEDRQWFKSRVGMDARETSRDIAFCSTAILQPDVFVVPDALADERFRDNPLVTSDPHIRFYAGAPLINEDGYALGTLCVVDRTPRDLAPDQKEALQALSRLVLAHLEFRRNLILLKEALSDRTKEEHERQRELLHVQETLLRVLGLRQPPKSASAN